MTQEEGEFSLPPDTIWEKYGALTQRQVSRKRLKQELAKFTAEYSAVKKGQKTSEWSDQIDDLLAQCLQALERRELGIGWHCYKAAQRTYLYMLDEDRKRQSEVQSRAIAVRNEAEKKLKGSWRYETIKEYLPDPNEEGTPKYSTDKIVEASKILDGYHDNVYERLKIINSRLNALTIFIILVITIWLIVPESHGLEFSKVVGGSKIPDYFWMTVLLFGIMGAIFSGFIFTSRETLYGKIPFQLLGTSLIFARLAVACLSALVMVIFLLAGIIKYDNINFEWILALAFVSGFSEQFVLRTIKTMSEET